MLLGLLDISVIATCFCCIIVVEGEVGTRAGDTQLLSWCGQTVSPATRILKLHLSLNMCFRDKQKM